MQTFKISNLKIMLVNKSTDRVCYVLYPLDILSEWIEKAARNFDVSIVVVTGMDWDNDLIPWPAKGEPQGCPDFKGNAPKFLSMLISDNYSEGGTKYKTISKC